MEEFNIYCDESSHLENDGKKAMVLGAIWCNANSSKDIFVRIREIKEKNNIASNFEIKWNKVSSTKIEFYEELIDFFFDNDELHFRALVIPDKSLLDHKFFNQTHDEYYYKMYFNLLKVILDPKNSHNIYIDKKDTKSNQRICDLKKILRNNRYDYSKNIIKKIQQVKAKEIELVQLTDLLIGSIAYLHNHYNTMEAKIKLIERIKSRSRYSLTKSTLIRESKFNLFIWNPKTLTTKN